MITPADILAAIYKRPSQSESQIDPDRGAGGNWRALKSTLKSKTASEKAKRAALKAYA
jgi:hypothetical protein